MSLTCFHTLSDAVLHRDPLRWWTYCEGCASVSDDVVCQAQEFDAMSPDERRRYVLQLYAAKLDQRSHEERNGRPQRAPWR